MTFDGTKLRGLREGRDWSQAKVAKKLSFELKRPIDARQVLRHEHGTQPGPEFIYAYARIFGLSPSAFEAVQPDMVMREAAEEFADALMDALQRRLRKAKVAA